MLSPTDDIFYRRYGLGATVKWLAFGTLAYDPSGVVDAFQSADGFSLDEGSGEDVFSIDLSEFH